MAKKLYRRLTYTGLFSCLFFFTACHTAPIYNADNLAQQYQWHRQIVETASLNLMVFSPTKVQNNTIQDRLFIYIEGDGQAWKSQYQASNNPTPMNAIGFGLATQHQANNAVYLARPCQYLSQAYLRNCSQALWTHGRYSEEVIAATHQAILQLKDQFGANNLVLVGYSGGGTLAAFVAAREKSVVQLITVAAPIDHSAWTQLQNVSPLSASLSIQNYVEDLAKIPQFHFTGSNDKVVPSQLTETWVARLRENLPHAQIELIELENVDHSCCWVEMWSELSQKYLTARMP